MLGMDAVFATDNFSTVLIKNLRNPRDYAPLTSNEKRKRFTNTFLHGLNYLTRRSQNFI